MKTIYRLKPAFQNLLRPVAATLVKAGLTANQITVGAVFLSAIGGGLVAFSVGHSWWLFSVPLILFVRMALNAIDGLMAKEHHQQSALGALLNETGDVVSDAVLYLPFAFLPGINPSFVVVVVVLAIVTEMVGVLSVALGGSRRYDGPLGKSDRAFGFGMIAVLLGTGIAPLVLINSLLVVKIVLLGWTVINRGRKALAGAEKC